jgi:RND family efflux transporter MFP subunit
MRTLGCGRWNAGPTELPPPQVTVSKQTQRDVTDFHHYTGHIESIETLELLARVMGCLQKIHFKEGVEVNKGDLLYEIDPSTFEADVQKAEADVSRAEAQLKLARIEADRAIRLRPTGAVSEEEYTQKIAARDTVEAALRQSRAALESAKLQLGYSKIRAPISGRIGRTLITEGNLVGSGEPTLLTTIVNVDPMYVYFDVPEYNYLEYSERIRNQGAVTAAQANIPLYVGLANEKDHPHEGVINYRDITATLGTGTITIRGRLPNPDRVLTPDLFARVRVPVGKPHKGLLVPQVAAGADLRGQYVLVVKPDYTVEHRPVTVGAEENGMFVIKEGLDPDDRVIVNGI